MISNIHDEITKLDEKCWCVRDKPINYIIVETRGMFPKQ